MEIIINPGRNEWNRLTERNIPADDPQVTRAVEEIVSTVARDGDKALIDYAARFDGAELTCIEIDPAEIAAAVDSVAPDVRKAIDHAAANIAGFHKAQLPAEVDVMTAPGVRCVQRAVPLRRAGLYIPGGRAPLFSTVLMLGIPARIAGCSEVILCTPASGSSPVAREILYAAKVCGIDHVYQVGGAQAIAAMAYGTETIPKVDKIFGPGNRYVTKAKQLVSTVTAIDMPAGPSEVMVLADDSADCEYVAADMLSQAEHGPDSQAMLVCDSERFAIMVKEAIDRQMKSLNRTSSISKSLAHSRAIVLPDRSAMIDFANEYASEHLIVSMHDPWEVADRIYAAGSVFIGNYSPESAGDYASGTNHTLPTGGWARSFSGVNIDSFMRKITYQQLTPEGLESLAPTIISMATAEGLDAHAAAVKVRTGR